MHLLFLAPETHAYNHEFIRGLQEIGATVTAIGHSPRERLSPALKPLLDEYAGVRNLLDEEEVLEAARRFDRIKKIDRVETIDEPLVVAAAKVREALGVPGLSVRSAELCRDKSEMKDLLRARGVPCAASTPARSVAEARTFAERVGYPLIVKPRAGFGSLGTSRVESAVELERILQQMRVGNGGSVLLEEFVDGHEGFYDTLTVNGKIVHDFVSHYYPGCLEALQDRRVSPQIAHTNRIDTGDYHQLREMGAKVNELLGIGTAATHMEWFFGSKGLRFSEIGARPAGEKIWDLYRVANDLDVYREWATAVIHGRVEGKPSRRLATGAIQIRPDRDGQVVGYEGLEEVRRRLGDLIYEHAVPPVGSATLPLEKGWHVNTWFRLRHPDYDELRRSLDFIGRTVRVRAR